MMSIKQRVTFSFAETEVSSFSQRSNFKKRFRPIVPPHWQTQKTNFQCSFHGSYHWRRQDRGRSEVWVYRGSRVRSPPVPVVFSVYQRGSLLDGLAMYLSCDTKKFYDNESTHILHNFSTSTHRAEASPWWRHGQLLCRPKR